MTGAPRPYDPLDEIATAWRAVADLRGEVDRLHRCIDEMASFLCDDGWIPPDWHLARTQIVILNVLVHRQTASRGDVGGALAAIGKRSLKSKTVSRHVSILRRELEPRGIVIEPLPDIGWRLSAASRVRIARLVGELAQMASPAA